MELTRVVWRKSSRSEDNGGQCVELADLTPEIGIRDSKNPQAGYLKVSRSELARLITRIKTGGTGCPRKPGPPVAGRGTHGVHRCEDALN